MSDETQEPKEDSPKPKKLMSPMFRNMVMAFLAIMLLLIVHVAGNIRAAGTQRADQLRMINAIASTLNDPVLQRYSQAPTDMRKPCSARRLSG
ncbi:MAG: hypothetical protein R2688_05190 [Fimbriimonadaceae bacterium]